MEIGDYQFSCSPDEYFDGVEDKCIPCENVCTREPLTFCKNNCPEFYKKLATATRISNADTSRTTFVDRLFFALTTTASSSPQETSSRSSSPTEVIPLTTLLALIAAVIAICIAVVAFILICKARRRARSDTKGHDTESPLLHGAESDSICRSNFSDGSLKSDNLNAHSGNSKAYLVCNHADPPDVARDAKEGDEQMSENTRTSSSSSSSSNRSSKNKSHT